ncbi:hypothetical protein [Cryptosporangium arvum]|uniref:HAF family repeat protein n=1 Tax=Cryptosporangium arvum DSM 44712 TaxID=927661 RepID=A0A010YN49_9ACTN|nr:hypothetical protein [Cryptosporangium arvum]EXG81625.1 HAF family repeat protein [Cryptosporangium arvum DSM 44712]
MRLLISGAVAVALLAPAGTASAAPTVTATPLPVPDGTTNSVVSDLNDAGVAVGRADVDGTSRALRWDAAGYTALPAPAQRPGASAARVSESGVVVGSIGEPDVNQRSIRHWRPDGTTGDCPLTLWAPLGVEDANESGDALVGTVTSGRRFSATVCRADGGTVNTDLAVAHALSDDGRVAGARPGSSATNYNYVPTVLSAGGTATTLPVPAGQAGVAYDFGPGDAVVGALGTMRFGTGPSITFVPRVAVIWSGGRITELGTLGGDTSVPADTGRAVNAAGDVIGTSTTASGETHAFRWRAGTLTDLGTLGGPSSAPTAINDQGQVVGASRTAAGETHAFRWDDGELTDLGAPGGTASSAADVNASGVVVGTVTTTTGTQAVRWTAS